VQEHVAIREFLKLRSIILHMAPVVVQPRAGKLRELTTLGDLNAASFQDDAIGRGPDEADWAAAGDNLRNPGLPARRDAVPCRSG
jgi:hypothetical protein